MASRSRAKRALELHEEKLLAIPNVVGLGIVPASERERSSTSLAVGVYVKQKIPRSELAADEVIPAYLEVPGRGRRVNKVGIRVIETGQVEFEEPGEAEEEADFGGFGTEAG